MARAGSADPADPDRAGPRTGSLQPARQGFKTGAIITTTSFDGSDLHNSLPRCTEQARAANQAFVDVLSAVAARTGATTAQVTLA